MAPQLHELCLVSCGMEGMLWGISETHKKMEGMLWNCSKVKGNSFSPLPSSPTSSSSSSSPPVCERNLLIENDLALMWAKFSWTRERTSSSLSRKCRERMP